MSSSLSLAAIARQPGCNRLPLPQEMRDEAIPGTRSGCKTVCAGYRSANPVHGREAERTRR